MKNFVRFYAPEVLKNATIEEKDVRNGKALIVTVNTGKHMVPSGTVISYAVTLSSLLEPRFTITINDTVFHSEPVRRQDDEDVVRFYKAVNAIVNAKHEQDTRRSEYARSKNNALAEAMFTEPVSVAQTPKAVYQQEDDGA